MSASHLKPVAAVALAATLIEFAGTHGAAAQNVSGPMALALAAVVAQRSPLVDGANKHIIARLFAGDSKVAVPAGKTISVMADSIVCRVSNVEITARSCELTFGSAKRKSEGTRGERTLRDAGRRRHSFRWSRGLDLRRRHDAVLRARSRRHQEGRRQRGDVRIRAETVRASTRPHEVR